MKKLSLLSLLLGICLLTGMTACGDDDKINDNIEKDLVLGTDFVFLKMSDGINFKPPTRSVAILSGNGGYTVRDLDASNPIVSAEIEGNNIVLTPKQVGKIATLVITDKLGKTAELKVVVDQEYILLEVSGFGGIAKTTNNALKKEIIDDIIKNIPMSKGVVFELSKGTRENKARIYENILAVINEKEAIEATFTLDTEAPYLTMNFDDKTEMYVLGGSYIKMLYTYFNVPMNFPKDDKEKSQERANLTPTIIFDLYSDVTEKYQQKYPNSDVDSVYAKISTMYREYKFLPVEE